MTKKRLRIFRCSLDSNGRPTRTGERFETLINPTDYEINEDSTYGRLSPIRGGSVPGMLKARIPAGFKIATMILDGTGVLTGGESVPVKDMVGQLYKVAYDFDVQIDSSKVEVAPVVELHWGVMLGYFRTKSITVKYTLFKPDGSPLRAELSLNFEVYQMPDLNAADVTFGDVDYFALARAGKVTSYRQVRVG